jgi:hypothetical protein
VELLARADLELGEDLAQVPLDGARAYEQLGADLLVRQPVAGEPSDLRFLRGEISPRIGPPLAHVLPGGQQLAAGAAGEPLDPAGCAGRGSARAAWETSARSPAPAKRPANSAAIHALIGLARHFEVDRFEPLSRFEQQRGSVTAQARGKGDLPAEHVHPGAIEAGLYFFCSEALTNIVKHAQATRAWVRLEVAADRSVAEVRDDGIGGARPRSEASGLIGLSDRIGAIGGTLDITSPDSGGTVLRASVPIPPSS